VKDLPVFKSLSVNSEKWLPIIQVEEVGLPDYLRKLKGEGYSLLGVEQTANSKNLLDYKFPHKSVLLLGNFFFFFFQL